MVTVVFVHAAVLECIPEAVAQDKDSVFEQEQRANML